jgi:hypothetical protein
MLDVHDAAGGDQLLVVPPAELAGIFVQGSSILRV